MIFHRFDFDGAKPCRIGNGSARHARKNHRTDDVDLSEATAHPAYCIHSELVNAVGHAGNIHQIAGQNEEGNRQQREGIHPADHTVHYRKIRHGSVNQHVEQRGDSHRQGHWHANNQKKEK